MQWSAKSDQLNANVVSWDAGGGVGAHVNDALDVVIAVLAGSGYLDIDGTVLTLEPGLVTLIQRGTRRAITAGSAGLRYVTCHQARLGAMHVTGVRTIP